VLRTTHLVVLLAALVCAAAAGGAEPAPAGRDTPPREVVVFAAGTNGYASFRIPAVVASAKGTLLAFAEGRKKGTSDTGDIDVVLQRSSDGGRTWGPLRVIVDDGADTVGNPCPFLDHTTKRVWLPLTRNAGANSVAKNKSASGPGSREVLMCFSDDDGTTWSKPETVSAAKPEGWTWYATGPGVGIQLKDGRLVIPCDHRMKGADDSYSHVIYSDDHGKSWKVGGCAAAKTNECAVIERDDGSLLLNMRSQHGKNRRATATSTDRGATWSEIVFEDALVEPTCQASLIRVEAKGKILLVFANPASTKRERMTVRLSADQGRTWPAARVLYPKSAAYSSLVALPGEQVGCLYERDGYKEIVFARFGLGWLAAGRDHVAP